MTIDESRWVQRASDFGALLSQRDDEDTFIIGHPGVTTMWTALAGLGPERSRQFSFLAGRADVTRRDGYFEALVAARRPFAIVAAVGVVLVTLLGWRLFGPGPAVLGGALLALEPFLVAHARVVHLDSSLTVYTAVCLLAALAYWRAGGGPAYLVLSGVAGGLAFLTKAPSVFVLGFVPLTVAAGLVARRERSLRALARAVVPLLLWGLVAAVVSLALWPALASSPVGTLVKMAQFTERVGGGEHDNFFFGEAREDPGPLFYPLALLFRLSPLTLLGLILAVASWRLVAPAHRSTALVLGLYCLGFGLMMSLAPKKFDRYLLPIFPMVGLIAGLGLWTALGRLSRPFRGGGRGERSVLALALLALQAAPLLFTHPYALAYYNPFLGGGAAAQRAILVGWGEGLDQVGRYLDAQPRLLGEPTVATSYHRVLQAQIAGSAVPLERVRIADYVVPYVNTLQRGAEREVLAPYLDGGQPEHVVWVEGIEYARVYRGPRYPAGGELGIRFGDRLTVVDYLAAPGAGTAQPGEEVQVRLRWDGAPRDEDRAAVLLLAPNGRVVVQDERPVGADGPDSGGRLGEVHRMTVPAGTPPGEYRLTIRVVESRGRMSLVTSEGLDLLVLRPLTVE